MKELTYLHCQQIELSDLGNNYFCYFKKHQGSAVIFIVLDRHPGKMKFIEEIGHLTSEVGIKPIIVTDV